MAPEAAVEAFGNPRTRWLLVTPAATPASITNVFPGCRSAKQLADFDDVSDRPADSDLIFRWRGLWVSGLGAVVAGSGFERVHRMGPRGPNPRATLPGFPRALALYAVAAGGVQARAFLTWVVSIVALAVIQVVTVPGRANKPKMRKKRSALSQ